MTVPGPWLRFDFALPWAANTPSEGQPAGPAPTTPLTFAAPERVIEAYAPEEVVPALAAAQAAAEAGRWVAGFVAYEAAPAFDDAMTVAARPPDAAPPLVWFGVYAAPAPAPPHADDPEPDPGPLPAWAPSVTRAAYDAAIAQIRAAIRRGDTYQVNHTVRLRGSWPGRDRADDLRHYARLRRAQQPRYAAYLDLGPYRVVSVSPELFFSRVGDRVQTRPMKGTAPRGRWPEEDVERRDALLASAKNRAENVMIVDLLRNDLGRLAVPGTLDVPQMLRAEAYPTVWQLTSTVEATVPAGTGLDALFGALFPCGSVTGAPKIATMAAIARLEGEPRDVYCGAVGLIAPGGDAVFNVAIRTVLVDPARGSATYGVGGGVTWDSTAADEYAELLAKAAVLTTPAPVFDLLETLRLTDGSYVLERRHLDRLRGTADRFGRPDPEAAARAALDAEAHAHREGSWRVRLLVDADGRARTEAYPLEPNPTGPVRILLADAPVDSDDLFLQHKTTHREAYAPARHQLAASPGAYDVVLHNERGELTESTTANLVVGLDGRRWTPPRRCGLLGGVERAEALADGRVGERVLTTADLDRAEGIWLVNGVRGWLPARIG